jgi:pimeloyl-ACP methyl ester carboxylesterase
MTRTRAVLTTSLLAFFSAAAANFAAAAPIETTDHMVDHRSTVPANSMTVPANSGHHVHLFVRERDGTPPGAPSRRTVLMLHGRSVPALPGFDLDHEQYSWAGDLAQKGFDVFVMDLQGSGRSPRPEMDDPCNANPAQQTYLIPNPLSEPCNPAYPFQLNNSQSDWDELGTVINFIRGVVHGPGGPKVRLVGWSAAAFQIGPYTMLHHDDVESILFLAPVFPPEGPGNTPPGAPGLLPTKPLSTPAEQYGFPMKINTKAGFRGPWDHEQDQSCPGQREDGIVDVVWKAIMENDVIGHHWGSVQSGQPEGVMRVRNAVWWGWNSDVVHNDPSAAVLGTSTLPVLIVYGALDSQANQTKPIKLSVPQLYKDIQGTTNKLMFRIACTGHFMPWESQYTILHRISEQWLRQPRVFGQTNGSYFLTQDGEIQPEQP